MGAKPPANVKARRATCKCDVCGRGFLSVQALRTHQSFTHPKSRQRVAYKPNTEVLAKRTIIAAPKVVKLPPPMPVEKKSEENTEEDNEEEDDNKARTKVEFRCPKCQKLFTAYFFALKHIQNLHCVNSQGEPVPPNSIDLIQPLRTEVCLTCNSTIDEVRHKCLAKEHYVKQAKQGLKCLACKGEFWRTVVFDLHISGMHSNIVETLLFPTFSEFTAWKCHTELQTQSSYIMMPNSTITEKSGRKTIYRCPYFCPNFSGDIAGFCPSSIIVQKFPKGYLTHFYKTHYGHITKPYKLDGLYKKCSINYLMSCRNYKEIKTTHETDGRYSDFRRVMEDIIVEAETADKACLKILLEKALEMSLLINKTDSSVPYGDMKISREYVESKNATVGENSKIRIVTDNKSDKSKNDTVTDTSTNIKVLDNSKNIQLPDSITIKVEDNDKNFQVSDSERKESDISKNQTDDEISLEPNEIRTRSKRKHDITPAVAEESSSKKLKTDEVNNSMMSPSNFIESFEHFIGNLSSTSDSRGYKNVRRPPGVVPKSPANITKTVVNVAKTPVNATVNPVISTPAPVNIPKSPVKKNEKKKEYVKTKIGQFKPSPTKVKTNMDKSEAKISVPKSEIKFDLSKVKTEIEYEVKEQENDCNILILKI